MLLSIVGRERERERERVKDSGGRTRALCTRNPSSSSSIIMSVISSVNSRWLQALRKQYASSGKQDVVLVTGACGQIGRDFVPILQELFGPEKVIATDIAKPTKEKVSGVDYDGSSGGTSAKGKSQFFELDVTDKTAVKDAIKSFKVNRIVHLATMLSAVGERLPMKAHDVNVQGSLNILEVAREVQQNTYNKAQGNTVSQ